MKLTQSPRKSSSRTPVQLELKSNSHGGRRVNAGRKKAKVGGRKVPHRTRAKIETRFPFHLTVRIKGRPVLRNKRSYHIFRRALGRAKCFGLRTLQFALLGNHFHLQGEADSNRAVAQGMRSVNCTLSKSIGVRTEDRYHIEINRTPAQVRATLTYVFANAAKHFKRTRVFDFFSSFLMFDDEEGILIRRRKDLDWRKPKIPAFVYMQFAEPLSQPKSWLAQKGWKKGK